MVSFLWLGYSLWTAYQLFSRVSVWIQGLLLTCCVAKARSLLLQKKRHILQKFELLKSITNTLL